ncbi:MAG: flavodoxin-dependent (E)-4-hydroxy-3-methylbut-2-enyl-diphosphate synthase [Spirochaetaceae bacterium]|nr:flavodoxin-dependent (E)-4-hydroxy-3-methylbut-2-enyl-diphosphate synthase [Spirochaetaceae bacterium]
MFTNKLTNIVSVGNIKIGGGTPVSIQTMWKKPLEKEENIIDQLKSLKSLGCDIIRFAVPDMKSAEILGTVAEISPIPVVADIHFDYKIALKCIDLGIHKIRINPGNIGTEWKVKEVIDKAKDKNIPIRVGINSGSLPVKLRNNKDKVSSMIAAAEEEIEIFEKYNFKNVVFSLKSPDVSTTISVNEMFAKKYSYPLHIGVTEAGPLIDGVVKNSAALLDLLGKDIGSTVRVSLSSTPENEVIAGNSILSEAGKRDNVVNLVSCPKCGRATFDVHEFISKTYDKIKKTGKHLTVSIMGCVVNGPQEAKDADIGITGVGNSIVIFKKGEIIKKTTSENAEEEFLREIEKL